jgi:hypothetical protein
VLALRLIAPHDYTALDDGQPIGRIRLARERSPSIWLWTDPPFGDAETIDDAKARFKAACWQEVKPSDEIHPASTARRSRHRRAQATQGVSQSPT